MVYYVYAYAQLAWTAMRRSSSPYPRGTSERPRLRVCRRMGIPVRKLLMPVNETTSFLCSWKAVSMKGVALEGLPVQRMNSEPSNLARFFDLYGGTVDRQGKVYVKRTWRRCAGRSSR